MENISETKSTNVQVSGEMNLQFQLDCEEHIIVIKKVSSQCIACKDCKTFYSF